MQQSSDVRSLVLVSGSGRSGTSSLAGSLKRLGLHVPQPEVEASPNNPRGYYEPAWVIDFHKSYLKELALHNIDSRPSAVDMVAEVVATGEPTKRLLEWLPDHLDHPQLVVKDPHALWFDTVWGEACSQLGVELRWLTALRHPAEVVGSRDIAYLQKQTDELRLVKETSNVAGWVHAALLTERAGRGGRRAFIRYADLLEDWRAALTPVQEELALDFNTDLASGDHHSVDDFLEAGMRKSHLTWDDIRVSDRLRDMAEEVWQLLGLLVDDPKHKASMDRLDEIRDDYVVMYREAAALTFDQQQGEAKIATRKVWQKNQELRERIQHLQRPSLARRAARKARRAMKRASNR